MSTTNLAHPAGRAKDPLAIIYCLCGQPHPCDKHGAWTRPPHEQLQFEVSDQ